MINKIFDFNVPLDGVRKLLTSFVIQPNDRVAAFHEMGSPGGGYAEYALAWAYTSLHIPSTISFEGKSQNQSSK